MADALPFDDQIMLGRLQRRRCMRLVILMTVLAGLSVVSQFVPLFGAKVGALPWWLAPIALVVLGWAMVTLRRVNDRLDQLEQQSPGGGMADGHDVPT